MRGVKFGDIHTGDDWELILNSKDLTPPSPKTNYVSVDGRDGDLDLTETLTGEVKYSNRSASFTFLLTDGNYADREELISEIINYIHGKKLDIILDDDPEYYLSGRCSVKSYGNDKAYGTLSIECNCDPWRYSVTDTVRYLTVDGSEGVLRCKNGGSKSVVPEITVEGTITLTIGDKSTELTSGKYKLLDFKLSPGVTDLIVNGNGSIKVVYKEAII